MKTPVPVTAQLLRTHAPPSPSGDSKDDRGRVLVIAGSLEVPGAALLAGTAALRIGAGKLQMAAPRDMAVALGLAVPEALVVGLPQTEDGGVAAACAPDLAARAAHTDAVLVGPGMNSGEETSALVAALLRDTREGSFLIDAAALGALPPDPALTRDLAKRPVITPHAGEMARLLDRTREAIEADPLDAARTAAARFGTVVVMKGSATYVVDPEGEAWCYEEGRIGLATSGSGDALAGFIVGLLARGADPVSAALWGVYVHGEAGRRLARSQGPLGFLARELAAEAPRIVIEVLE